MRWINSLRITIITSIRVPAGALLVLVLVLVLVVVVVVVLLLVAMLPMISTLSMVPRVMTPTTPNSNSRQLMADSMVSTQCNPSIKLGQLPHREKLGVLLPDTLPQVNPKRMAIRVSLIVFL